MAETRSARILRQIREVCEIAGIKTEEYARVTKKRLDVMSITRELGRERGALGERVYDLSLREDHGDVLEDVTVQAILNRIQSLEASLRDHEEEIGEIRESARDRALNVRRKPESAEGPDGGPTPAGGGEEVREKAPVADDDFIEEEGPEAATGGKEAAREIDLEASGSEDAKTGK
ncbi:MAG: hypothetical protein KAY24_09495 [Candidatus Eisenbacteria sp.]|nr:hypothetical protein [Candidatus Eisenbacteria bacterium]